MIKVGWAVAAEAGHDISHDDQGLWPTVLLLLRQHSDEERIEYPLTPSDGARQLQWPIRPTPHRVASWDRWSRKRGGATLGDRAQRQREPGSDPYRR